MRRFCESLPGTGGQLKTVPEDFCVDELPAYPPSGEGAHTLLHIEKRGLTTDEAVRRLCAALGRPRDDAGVAGQKDRQAVTRQWISLPEVDPARALDLRLDGVLVLQAVRHPHKLRTGHLRGNRFTVTLRGTTDGVSRARAVLDRLQRTGLPNRFGPQRFGRGDNAARGRALLRGERLRVGRHERRLLVSAYQSELFNRYLDERVTDESFCDPVVGDVLQRTDSGGLFVVVAEELHAARARLLAAEVAITGPMFGHKMMTPPPDTPARAREDALLAAEGIALEQFTLLGKIAEGTRRPLSVRVEDAAVEDAVEGEGVIVLSFTLPPGSYATVLLEEVMGR